MSQDRVNEILEERTKRKGRWREMDNPDILEQRKRFQTMHEKNLQEIRFKHNRAIEYAMQKCGMSWDRNRQRLDFYDYFEEYLLKEE